MQILILLPSTVSVPCRHFSCKLGLWGWGLFPRYFFVLLMLLSQPSSTCSIKGGEVVDRLMGANPARLQELINEHK